MSKRVHLSGRSKRKLKTQRIEKEKLIQRINIFFNTGALENNTCLIKTVKSISAETNYVSNLKLPV
jgi:hypothetical protein